MSKCWRIRRHDIGSIHHNHKYSSSRAIKNENWRTITEKSVYSFITKLVSHYCINISDGNADVQFLHPSEGMRE